MTRSASFPDTFDVVGTARCRVKSALAEGEEHVDDVGRGGEEEKRGKSNKEISRGYKETKEK